MSLSDCTLKPTELVFVLDESGSVGEANFQLQNQFVAKLVEGFDIGITSTQVAVMTFASSVVIEFYLNAFNDKIQLLERIKHINYSHPGLTITHSALRTLYCPKRCFYCSKRNEAKCFALRYCGDRW